MTRMTRQEAIDLLRRRITVAKQQEIEMNICLGHPDDYMRGSQAVTVRWDVLELALSEEEK